MEYCSQYSTRIISKLIDKKPFIQFDMREAG